MDPIEECLKCGAVTYTKHYPLPCTCKPTSTDTLREELKAFARYLLEEYAVYPHVQAIDFRVDKYLNRRREETK